MAFDTDYGLAAYCASKAGVGGLTRTLALELGKFNITANYVCPGAIYTGMTRTNFDNPEIRAVWEKKAALRRLGQPIDIARGALLLASDDADFITGHELVVDGGSPCVPEDPHGQYPFLCRRLQRGARQVPGGGPRRRRHDLPL